MTNQLTMLTTAKVIVGLLAMLIFTPFGSFAGQRVQAQGPSAMYDVIEDSLGAARWT